MIPVTQPHPLLMATVSVWFGLLTGPAELALVLAQKQLRDGTPGFFQMNRQIVWMTPLFHLLLFAAIGGLIGLLAGTWSKFSTRRAAFFLGFVSLTSLALAVRSIHPLASVILGCGLAYRAAARVEASCLRSSRLVLRTFPVLAGVALILACVSVGAEAWADTARWPTCPRPIPVRPMFS